MRDGCGWVWKIVRGDKEEKETSDGKTHVRRNGCEETQTVVERRGGFQGWGWSTQG